MDFNIHQFKALEPGSEEAEEALEEFQDELVSRFLDSPPGQQLLEANGGAGFWAAQLIHYGWEYLGVVVPEMTVGNVREVVARIFPRKISLHSPDDAEDAIPELVAFWEFLGDEFHLRQAEAILEYLRNLGPSFPGIMNNPANFGMAKSFFVMGQAAGYDMTSEAGLKSFMSAYNTGLAGNRLELPLHDGHSGPVLEPDQDRRRSARKEKAKQKRKRAEAKRKRRNNRRR